MSCDYFIISSNKEAVVYNNITNRIYKFSKVPIRVLCTMCKYINKTYVQHPHYNTVKEILLILRKEILIRVSHNLLHNKL